MNNVAVKKWIDALRSGDYTQCKNMLRDKDSFCVLGVLCDIHSKEFHCEEDWHGELYKMYMNSLPPEVCNWLGEENFELIFGGSDSLIDLNDDGHVDFKELADEIERRAEKFKGATNE